LFKNEIKGILVYELSKDIAKELELEKFSITFSRKRV